MSNGFDEAATLPGVLPGGSGDTQRSPVVRWAVALAAGALVFAGLYATSLYSYLLFHSLAELFSVLVALSIFVVAWNTRDIIDNNHLLFLGIAYFFVGSLDLVHALAYSGMNVFPGYGSNLPTQLWIQARSMQSVSFLIAPFWLGRKLPARAVLTAYALLTAALLAVIFYWPVFPTCYVEGLGLTPFKKVSEYVIAFVLLAALVPLFANRAKFDPAVFLLATASIVATIASELCFTLYVGVYESWNLVGHLLKILSFFFIYLALVHTGLRKPYALLFRGLKQSEERYRAIVEDQTELICRFSPDGRLTFVNDAYCLYFGTKREALIGQRFLTRIPEEEREAVTGRLASLSWERPSVSHEHGVLAPDGEKRWHQWTNRATFDDHRRLVEFQGVGRDVTARKRAGEQLRRHEKELALLVEERTAELRRANLELTEEMAERKRLEREVLDISESEQRRISQDLHDGLGQHLMGIALKSELLAQTLAEHDECAAKDAEEIHTLVHDAISQTRLLAKGLAPVKLELGGLMSALQELALFVNDVFAARCVLVCDPPVHVADSMVATHLYRIAQEAVTNALKHGKAPNITLSLASEHGRTVLTVKDDGAGLPPEPDGKAGMGLRTMSYRAAMIGGRCELKSAPDGGTLVVCSCPEQGSTDTEASNTEGRTHD